MIRFSEIGEAIRKVRLGKGLSQDQLAHQLGLTQRTISHVESGRDVRLATLVEIARALDLEPLLVPRNLVSAISTIIGGDDLPPPAFFSGDDDEVYNEQYTSGKLDGAVSNDLNRIGRAPRRSRLGATSNAAVSAKGAKAYSQRTASE